MTERIKFQGLPITNDHRTLLAILSILAVMFSIPGSSAAPPIITSFTSDTNGTSQYIKVPSATTITFTVVAPGATSYNWYVDSWLNTTEHTDTLIMTMTAYHSIAVSAINVDGASGKQYKSIVVDQLIATNPVPLLNNSGYQYFETIILPEPNLLTILHFAPLTYTTLIGSWFYALIWSMVALMIWIRTDKITIITTLGFIIGGYAIGSLPSSWKSTAQLIIIGGFAVTIFYFLKERR